MVCLNKLRLVGAIAAPIIFAPALVNAISARDVEYHSDLLDARAYNKMLLRRELYDIIDELDARSSEPLHPREFDEDVYERDKIDVRDVRIRLRDIIYDELATRDFNYQNDELDARGITSDTQNLANEVTTGTKKLANNVVAGTKNLANNMVSGSKNLGNDAVRHTKKFKNDVVDGSRKVGDFISEKSSDAYSAVKKGPVGKGLKKTVKYLTTRDEPHEFLERGFWDALDEMD